ncbi:MAG: glycosyltransferase family 4 protein [Zoogloeaceae bacterium]|nr:glycosyltransferase family 4 protein [Zoogloeaceae bacterium]
MRVLHVVRQYLPSVGGMEDVVRQIARQQLAIGQRPRILTLDRIFHDRRAPLAAAEEVEGVPVQRLPFAGSRRYPLCPQALGALGDSDVIHVHGVDFFFDYLAVTRGIHRRPLVASTHGGFFHTAFAAPLKRAYFRTVTRRSARAYARIVATSEHDGTMFAPILGDHQLAVIENGVDIAKFHNAAASTLIPTLICFGRWSANKGLAETLDLLRHLRAVDPAWRLILAGRPFDHAAVDLATWAEARGVQDAVRIVADPSESEIAALIGEASYFVSLSRHEGFGLAAIEALSAGLQPVLSDIPPFRRLVELSGQGLLVDRNDLASAAARLVADHRHGAWNATTGGRRAGMAFAQRYDWSQVAQRYFEVYADAERGR